MKRIVFLILIIGLLCPLPAYSLEWIKLHDESSRRNLKQALEAIRENPESQDNLYILGLIYLNLHKDPEAESTFRQLLKQNPSIFEARWGLAEVLRRKKINKESQKILNEIIIANPKFSPAYISLAYLKYTQADFNAAVKSAKKVIKQGRAASDTDNFARAYLIFAGSKGLIASRGGPLSKLINGTQVLPNLKKAERLRPNASEVLFGLGNFYFLAPGIAGGNLKKAEKYLKSCIEKDPLFTDAYVRLAQIYKVKKDAKNYQLYIAKAKKIDPDNELLQDELSQECKFNCETVEE